MPSWLSSARYVTSPPWPVIHTQRIHLMACIRTRNKSAKAASVRANKSGMESHHDDHNTKTTEAEAEAKARQATQDPNHRNCNALALSLGLQMAQSRYYL